MTKFNPGCHSVALYIVEPVCIELTRDDSSVDVLGLLLFEECTNLARQLLVHAPKDMVYFGAALNDLRTPILMPLGQVSRLGSRFERMAERAVTNIVQQGSEKRDSLPAAIMTSILPTGDDIGELTCRVVDADAVRKSTVRRTWKDQIGEA